MRVNKKEERIGIEKYNYQNCLMTCVVYNNANDIIVEFQDKYKGLVHTNWNNFCNASVKNPYYPDVCDVGMCGVKYPIRENGKISKEYIAWRGMLSRSFNKYEKERNSAYEDVTCCEEWLLYENFYEWLHSQENFDKWHEGNLWAVDKDILVKGNKIYSPETCCLVPKRINNLFLKSDKTRGDLPIGVTYKKDAERYYAKMSKQKDHQRYFIALGYPTPEEAFEVYKQMKEDRIKQLAKEEYDKNNITKQCYDAMMTYEVEITD